MTRLIRAEIKKLTSTLGFWIAMAVIGALCPLAAVANVFSHQGYTLGSTEHIHHVLAVSAITSLAMLAIGIITMAGEYRHGTIAPTFLVTPKRHRVVAAKVITVGGTGAVVGAAAFLLALAVAVPTLSTKGVHHLSGDIPQLLVGTALATGLFGILGVAVGALFRNTVIAMVVALGWAWIVEAAILQAFAPQVDKWLPTGANLALTRSATVTNDLLNPWAAAVILVGYAVLLSGAATRFTVRRDIA